MLCLWTAWLLHAVSNTVSVVEENIDFVLAKWSLWFKFLYIANMELLFSLFFPNM